MFYGNYSSTFIAGVIILDVFINEWFSYEGLLLFFLGFIAAVIGVMFGAAGFVLLPSMLLLGVPIHASVAANKFATGLSAFSNVLTFIIKKQVSIKRMIPLIIFSIIGGVSGAFLATRLSEETMNIVASIILIGAFFVVLKSNKIQGDLEMGQSEQKTAPLIPFFISVYDGGFGPGSGLMNITYFLKKNYVYQKAVQYSRIIMFSSCTGAFTFYYFYGIVIWEIAIPVTIGSIIGSFLGLKIVPYIKGKWVQVLLPTIFFILIVQVVSDLLF